MCSHRVTAAYKRNSTVAHYKPGYYPVFCMFSEDALPERVLNVQLWRSLCPHLTEKANSIGRQEKLHAIFRQDAPSGAKR